MKFTAVIKSFIVALLTAAALSSCTSARWTVKTTDAVDRNESEIIERQPFLTPEGRLSPENPVLRLNLQSAVTSEYPQRVLMQRMIQDYRPRAGYVALGLAGAAASFYAANSSVLSENGSPARSITLNTAGALLALSGFLNMKPVGEPRATGEERYLRSTGSVTKTDTVDITETIAEAADIIIQYDDRIIIEEKDRKITSGNIELQLANVLNDLRLTENNPGDVEVRVEFYDSTYTYRYPVEDILVPYARITAPLTELRSKPSESPSTALAELLRDSQLQIVGMENERWYRVLYGTSQNYILRNDAELTWRPSGFINDNNVVTLPQIPFGNIDVETNIPVLRNTHDNLLALVVTNESYSGDLPPRSYSHRDGRLIKRYLEDALGYPAGNIIELQDIKDDKAVKSAIGQLQKLANDSSEVFVFLNGHGIVEQNNGSYQLGLIPAATDSFKTNNINLESIYGQLAQIPAERMIVINDIGFTPESGSLTLSRSESRQIYNNNFSVLTNSNSGATVIVGLGIGQQSGLYLSSSGGEDKKHRIFPYYFAQALQQRNTDISAIYQHLERNVSYTSRRLHDRSQDPILLGATNLDLTSE